MAAQPPPDPEEQRRTHFRCPGCGWAGTGAEALAGGASPLRCPDCDVTLEPAGENGELIDPGD